MITHKNRSSQERPVQPSLAEIEDMIAWVFGPDDAPAYARNVRVADVEAPRVQAIADAVADC